MFDLRQVKISDVSHLFEKYHGYKSTGGSATYAFAVYEGKRVVAAYLWQPPPPGAARSVCSSAPHGVLALSRMVAVPKRFRKLKHISKPLKKQFKIIDRTRYPVLITYSDEGQGHTGYVYQCSGMTKTVRSKAIYYEDQAGRRISSYSCGAKRSDLMSMTKGTTYINRWEHWACPANQVRAVISKSWRRVRIEGKTWRSGNPAYRFIRRSPREDTNRL